MELKDIAIDQDMLVEAAKVENDGSLANAYKWYIHLQYIKYIEGVAGFLDVAADTDTGSNLVTLDKNELKRLVRTLLKTKTYGYIHPSSII